MLIRKNEVIMSLILKNKTYHTGSKTYLCIFGRKLPFHPIVMVRMRPVNYPYFILTLTSLTNRKRSEKFNAPVQIFSLGNYWGLTATLESRLGYELSRDDPNLFSFPYTFLHLSRYYGKPLDTSLVVPQLSLTGLRRIGGSSGNLFSD